MVLSLLARIRRSIVLGSIELVFLLDIHNGDSSVRTGDSPGQSGRGGLVRGYAAATAARTRSSRLTSLVGASGERASPSTPITAACPEETLRRNGVQYSKGTQVAACRTFRGLEPSSHQQTTTCPHHAEVGARCEEADAAASSSSACILVAMQTQTPLVLQNFQ